MSASPLPSFVHLRLHSEYSISDGLTRIDEAIAQARKTDDPRAWLHRFLDLSHSVEMMERVLRDRGIDVDKEYNRIVEENRKRGLYE